jgi:hypothetical protein
MRFPPKSTVTTVGRKSLPVTGQGTAIIDSNKAVRKVLYIPSMVKNLISVDKLANQGYLTLFDAKRCWVFGQKDPIKILLSGSRTNSNSLYRLHTSISG